MSNAKYQICMILIHLCSCRHVLNRLLIWSRKKISTAYKNEQKDFNEETIDDSQEERAKNFNEETNNDDDDLPFAKAALASPWHRWELRKRGDCSSCSPEH